ncbi:hypothetical protein H6F90_13645 [Trichocoleus sp. FACHB-591]|uniref:hypothetical protein n=1 Tax=Trichocoleus sp. FACHB-591 TaxID=2692872 RepID=UPI00168924C7|nr:hypothetical protein [Trichocoleus sp. FACHB-591]MBD2096181.1 hypothetical protein [Trichocoleus sp. FACHB-591]
MPHKHKNLLSTIRALGDKQLTLTQQASEAKEGTVEPQLHQTAEEFEPGHQEPDTASNELIAPLLIPSTLEERLEAQLSLDTETVETAETLHLTEITAAVEVEAPQADPETPPSGELAIAEPKLEESKPEESKPEQPVAEESELAESKSEAPEPETPKPEEPVAIAANFEEQVAAKDTAAPTEEPAPQQPTSSAPSLQTTANPENNGNPNGANDDNQAIAPNLEAKDLLKRPEAFALIVCTFFIAIWQTLVGIGQEREL